MAENSTTVSHELVRATRRLAQGGEASVYSVVVTTSALRSLGIEPGAPLVYKRFHEPSPSHSHKRLEALVRLRHEIDPRTRTELDARASWPLAVVVAEEALGVLLPAAPSTFNYPFRLASGRDGTALLEVQHLMARPGQNRRVGLPPIGIRARLAVAVHIVDTFSLLHATELVYGDLSAKNVVVRLRPEGMTYLLDCDGCRQVAFGMGQPAVESPDWDPPEGSRRPTQRTDAYKLGLLVGRLLAAIGGSARAEALEARLTPLIPDELLVALRASLREDPKLRPPVADWSDPLRSALDTI